VSGELHSPALKCDEHNDDDDRKGANAIRPDVDVDDRR